MFQRLILTLKQRELLTPVLFILALLLVLSLIIILGQFFHQSLQDEMAGQFNQQQLLLAREVAMNIEGYVNHVFKSIRVISHLPDIQHIERNPQCSAVVEAINFSIQDEALVTIRVLNRDGILLYDSSSPGRRRGNFSNTDYFKKTRELPRNEKLVTDLLEIHDSKLPETKEFIVSTPIYGYAGRDRAPAFTGAVLAVVSMDGITRKYIAPVKSGTRGYAWMMDSDGTLLYHPMQPQMVGKNFLIADNVTGPDRTCNQCHRSFDAEKRMIAGTTDPITTYQTPDGELKLAAYYTFPIARKSWIVVVSAPYSDVISLMQKSRSFYLLLILSIMITTLAFSGATIVNYKKKIKAEEKAMHYENQRRLEQEIEIQKDYLENIIENTKTNLMVVDKDLVVRTLNTAQARTFGMSKEDLLGKSLLTLFPDDFNTYEGIPIESILRKSLSGRSFEIKDYRITALRDTPLYLTMYFSPLIMDGKAPGILITSNDVTIRVQLEEALKKYTLELEDKVHIGTATAKKLEQQVMHSEKLAALGRLAAGVAHEIGNPLTSISSFAQLLREMATDEFSQSSLDIINNHIQRITDIVRRMSTFARADSLNIKPVQLNDVMNSTLDLMRLDKRMKSSIEIALSLGPSLPLAQVDEGQMQQVFINIIINALDAMPDGGILRIATRTGIDDQDRESIMISFADSGIGIPPAEIVKIFDPFYTTKEAGKGTGLGLSLSYNIIKQFKGDIKVESEPGRGTTFTVILPREQG